MSTRTPTEQDLRREAELLAVALLADADAEAAAAFDRVAAYLDGNLEPHERELLEQDARASGVLSAAIEELAELRAEISSPSAPSRLLRWRSPSMAPAWRRLAAGAALAAGLTGVYLLAGDLAPGRSSQAPGEVTEVAVSGQRLEPIFTGGFEDQSLAGWSMVEGTPSAARRQ
jgi:ferric-dicitrate binding protein FerR (iron transport regulator)